MDVALTLSAIEDIIATQVPQNALSEETTSCHTYSDQTSNKLNNSLIDISGKVSFILFASALYIILLLLILLY